MEAPREARNVPMKYIKKILLGLDQFGNTLMGGYPDETISARAGRHRGGPRLIDRLWWTPLAHVLNDIQDHHVEGAECHETDGSQNDPAYKDAYKGSCEVPDEAKK